MTFVSNIAFLASTPQTRLPVSHFLGSTATLGTHITRDHSQTALLMSASPVLANCASSAINFFTGLRTPAALIAGSSSGLFFVNVQKKDKEVSKLRKVVSFIYHMFALVAFLLSLNVIVVSTAASNTLLLNRYNTAAASVYDFLQREIFYEYITTRWSFYSNNLI